MKKFRLIISLTLLPLILQGMPAKSAQKEKKQASSAGSVKSKTTTKYQRSTSEETSAARDKRLFRECKGMHNAGACRGYTSK
jgi:hypothetical protein